ncbi:integrase catalytic domain-containing protein [Trichonephila clavipes]|nr:integrase catalytic domain-containing protein [Trichonephila clavipes]
MSFVQERPSRSPRSNTTRKQVCIPHCLKAKILESVHSEYGGHLKFFKTYHRLSENFFWQNMYKYTKNFVRSCTICLSRKNAFKIPPAPHQPVEQSKEPGETCHMDIFRPLKTTPKVMGIHKRHISSYSAHVNGRVEKPNQSLANILASISQNTNDWDEQLPHTMLALNSAIHEATYTSPFFLEHGRDIRLSYTYERNSDTPQNKYEYVEKLLPSLEHIFNKVLNNLKDQEASHVELSTRATKQHHYDYKIGSLCFIKTPNIKSNLPPKLRPKFEGPYRAWERVTLFGGVRETHSPNSVSCKQQEQGRCKNCSCNFRDRRPPISIYYNKLIVLKLTISKLFTPVVPKLVTMDPQGPPLLFRGPVENLFELDPKQRPGGSHMV